ncbi:MAG: hypothetical protein NZ480_00215 [Bdellovibrionaceae bacterium]|nr:hypothetical protein [Pseudobdellovibrionaceae bacterium]MDW8189642.1 hypothetical protein [Pseudobdellovibrionaceae bacterium]
MKSHKIFIYSLVTIVTVWWLFLVTHFNVAFGEEVPVEAPVSASSDVSSLSPEPITLNPEDSAIKTKSDTLRFELQGHRTKLEAIKNDPKCAKLHYLTDQTQRAIESCEQSLDRSATFCLESLSPAIQAVIPQLSIIGAALSVVTGMNEKCRKANQGYDLLKGALSAYQGMCGGTQIMCTQSCNTAHMTIERLRKEIPNVLGPNGAPLCNHHLSILSPIQGALESSVKHCNNYQTKLVGAGAGIAAMIVSMAKSKECANQTSSNDKKDDPCLVNPNGPGCVDCTKSQYFNHPTCICAHNPRAAGCAKAEKNHMNSPDRNGLENGSDGSQRPAALARQDGLSDNWLGGAGSGNTQVMGGGAGGFMGSGGGGLGASGMGPGSSGNDKKKENPSQEASVLQSNVGGGGGGGGGWGGGYRAPSSLSGSYFDGKHSKDSSRDGLKNGNDRAMAALEQQISGKNGLSNFEKVKRRYQAERVNLLTR